MRRTTIAKLAGRWSLYGLLASWFGLTLYQQAGAPHWLQAKVDPIGITIPNWRFFAPLPGRHDYNVLYRDRLPDGTVTAWREEEISVPRKMLQMVWHPRRRMEKALSDVASQLFSMVDKVEDRTIIQLLMPYLALLNFVTNQVPHRDGAVDVQFMIAQSATYDPTVEPAMMFLSEWHSLYGEARSLPAEAAREAVPAG
ncbi:hypothetical protein [Amycolatopsis minnesotensis]